MKWPILLFLLVPAAARAQFSVVVTELGSYNSADGPEYAAQCAKDACRATLPVQVGAVRCVLNVRVGAPTSFGAGRIIFAAGPCERGAKLAIDQSYASVPYELDRFGAATKQFVLPFLRPSDADHDPYMDDGVVHGGAAVRLDIIATQAKTGR
jgi:hypothetical protein